MIIKLQRYSYGEYETEGQLIIGSRVFATIEQPWTPNPNGFKGGKPFESCIPDGMYRLVRFIRPNKEGSAAKAWMIFNPDLGVYRFPDDHEQGSGVGLEVVFECAGVVVFPPLVVANHFDFFTKVFVQGRHHHGADAGDNSQETVLTHRSNSCSVGHHGSILVVEDHSEHNSDRIPVIAPQRLIGQDEI